MVSFLSYGAESSFDALQFEFEMTSGKEEDVQPSCDDFCGFDLLSDEIVLEIITYTIQTHGQSQSFHTLVVSRRFLELGTEYLVKFPKAQSAKLRNVIGSFIDTNEPARSYKMLKVLYQTQMAHLSAFIRQSELNNPYTFFSPWFSDLQSAHQEEIIRILPRIHVKTFSCFNKYSKELDHLKTETILQIKKHMVSVVVASNKKKNLHCFAIYNFSKNNCQLTCWYEDPSLHERMRTMLKSSSKVVSRIAKQYLKTDLPLRLVLRLLLDVSRNPYESVAIKWDQIFDQLTAEGIL